MSSTPEQSAPVTTTTTEPDDALEIRGLIYAWSSILIPLPFIIALCATVGVWAPISLTLLGWVGGGVVVLIMVFWEHQVPRMKQWPALIKQLKENGGSIWTL